MADTWEIHDRRQINCKIMQDAILGEVKSIGIERTTVHSGFQLPNSWNLLGCVINNTSFHTYYQCSNGFWVMNQMQSEVLSLSKTQEKSIQKRWSRKQILEQIIMVNRKKEQEWTPGMASVAIQGETSWEAEDNPERFVTPCLWLKFIEPQSGLGWMRP